MTYPLEAVTPEGKPYPLPELSIRSEGDGYRFTPDVKSLVMLAGHFKQQDFWLVDLTNNQRRQLTRLKLGFSVTGFDVSPDGKQILFDRVRENSEVVLIDLKR